MHLRMYLLSLLQDGNMVKERKHCFANVLQMKHLSYVSAKHADVHKEILIWFDSLFLFLEVFLEVLWNV